MTALKAHCDIRLFEKHAYLLACPPAKKEFWTEFQTDLSGTPSFAMRYDCMYSSQVYSGSP